MAKIMKEIIWDSSNTGTIKIYPSTVLDNMFPAFTCVPGVYHIDNIKQELLFESEYIDINLVRLQAALLYRGVKENSDEWCEAMEMQAHDSPGVWLFGDWFCNNNFIFEPGLETNFSATYDAETSYMIVERSEFVTMCKQTSRCFVIYDGAAEIRCGDIVSQKDDSISQKDGSIYAFCLPEEWHEGE